jgi:hypothetical protein
MSESQFIGVPKEVVGTFLSWVDYEIDKTEKMWIFTLEKSKRVIAECHKPSDKIWMGSPEFFTTYLNHTKIVQVGIRDIDPPPS